MVEQMRLERKIQFDAFEWVPSIPLGRHMPSAAWSNALSSPAERPRTGVLECQQILAASSSRRSEKDWRAA
jgi:hypothetical protein